MKMLFSRGNFSWDGKTINTGLICFCHINTSDTIATVEQAVKKIECRRIKKSKEPEKETELENLILVPFSNLDEEIHTMNFDDASLLFKKITETVVNPIVVPFLPGHKFHWDLPTSGYTKFISI